MIDVLFFDDRGGFGPTFNRTHAVGGAEMHLVQVAEYLAAKSLNVVACTKWPEFVEENGVMYFDSDKSKPGSCRTLIVVGCASLPPVRADKVFAFQVVDPRPHPQLFDHLKGRATMVCVSEFQANLFRELGHEAIVIPVPIPDEWYGMPRTPVPGRFVCVSSWNKGARETIDMWRPEWGELAVGSPYSHPDDADRICRARGVTWLGTLRPRETWIKALSSGSAVARVCTIAETFGVTDVAARAMGMESYTLCTGEVGSLDEVGAHVYTRYDNWARSIERCGTWSSKINVNDFRASRVLPKWVELVS